MSGLEGARFGKYRLMHKIAAGGMGEVYLAKLKGPSGFEKLVVIKRLLDHRQKEQKYIDMFFAEARTAAQLNHSNIVQIYEPGNHDGEHYIAMEYVAGKSFRRVLDAARARDGRLHTAYVVQVIIELCTGLAFAHDARHLSGAPMGLIHRDINPHNVLVSYQGVVKIIDFGIAKSELNRDKTQAGTIKGTVVYMSPEQSSGMRLDKRSDLFSVGICLYEALTGTNPFHKDSLGASLEAIRNAAVPPIGKRNAELEVFSPIITKALARDPEDRYADCLELARELQGLVQRELIKPAGEPLAEYMRTLFADEISDEERRITQTELAEIPNLNETATLASGITPGVPVPHTESPTVRDGLPISLRLHRQTSNMSHALRKRVPVLRSVKWNYVGIGSVVIAGYILLWWALRPTPTPQISNAPSANHAPAGTVAASAVPQHVEGADEPVAGSTTGLAPAPAASAPPQTQSMAGASAAAAAVVNNVTEDVAPHEHRLHHGARPDRRHPKSHTDTMAGLGALQLSVDPPVRATINGNVVSGTMRVKSPSGVLQVGTGQDADNDPFVVKVRYRIVDRNIVYSVESEPWATVRGAGGITLGRTPLAGISGGAATVFELSNPKLSRTQRITVRFATGQ